MYFEECVGGGGGGGEGEAVRRLSWCKNDFEKRCVSCSQPATVEGHRVMEVLTQASTEQKSEQSHQPSSHCGRSQIVREHCDPWTHSSTLPSPRGSPSRMWPQGGKAEPERNRGVGVKSWRRQWTLYRRAGFRFRHHSHSDSNAEEAEEEFYPTKCCSASSARLNTDQRLQDGSIVSCWIKQKVQCTLFHQAVMRQSPTTIRLSSQSLSEEDGYFHAPHRRPAWRGPELLNLCCKNIRRLKARNLSRNDHVHVCAQVGLVYMQYNTSTIQYLFIDPLRENGGLYINYWLWC